MDWRHGATFWDVYNETVKPNETRINVSESLAGCVRRMIRLTAPTGHLLPHELPWLSSNKYIHGTTSSIRGAVEPMSTDSRRGCA